MKVAYKFRMYPDRQQEAQLDLTLDICRHLWNDALADRKSVVLVDPRRTSQRCSACGQVVPKTLKDRVHVCPRCGLIMCRDLNSSIEIRTLGLRGIACGDLTTTLSGCSKQARSMKQEALPI